MGANNCAGVCTYEDFRLEYQIEYLEIIFKRSLKIQAVCYNPYNLYDREAIFKYSTNNLSSNDIRLKIAMSMIESLIKDLRLDKNKLYKFIVKNKQVFYIGDV